MIRHAFILITLIGRSFPSASLQTMKLGPPNTVGLSFIDSTAASLRMYTCAFGEASGSLPSTNFAATKLVLG
jgi:hypothetical protein